MKERDGSNNISKNISWIKSDRAYKTCTYIAGICLIVSIIQQNIRFVLLSSFLLTLFSGFWFNVRKHEGKEKIGDRTVINEFEFSWSSPIQPPAKILFGLSAVFLILFILSIIIVK
jgi:hypothetical protein